MNLFKYFFYRMKNLYPIQTTFEIHEFNYLNTYIILLPTINPVTIEWRGSNILEEIFIQNIIF